jgi:hypothetical protein
MCHTSDGINSNQLAEEIECPNCKEVFVRPIPPKVPEPESYETFTIKIANPFDEDKLIELISKAFKKIKWEL